MPLDAFGVWLGWLEADQRDAIAFLREENRVLKVQLSQSAVTGVHLQRV